jgi:hypothetical protein
MMKKISRRVLMKRVFALGLLAAAGVAIFGLSGKAEVYVGRRIQRPWNGLIMRTGIDC